MAKRKAPVGVPEVAAPAVDLEAIKREAIRRTEKEMSDDIRTMTPQECMAKLGDYGRRLVKRLTTPA